MHERVHANDGCKSQKKKTTSNFLKTQRETLLASVLKPNKFVLAFAEVRKRKKSAVVDSVLFTEAGASLYTLAMWVAPQTLQLQPFREV